MKLFAVVHEYGEYSDKGWSFMGVFSTKEKAEEFIEEKCRKIDPETKRTDWAKAKTEFDTWNQNFLKQRKILLESREVELQRLKEKQAEFSATHYDGSTMQEGKEEYYRYTIKHLQNEVQRMQDEITHVQYHPPSFPSLEAYTRVHYATPHLADMQILEVELDREAPGPDET